MTLKDQIKQDANRVFLNMDEFSEEITYVSAGLEAKVLKAIILRQKLEPGVENTGRSLKNQTEIFISTDPVEGIAEINRKDDRVTLADTEGTLQEARINDVLGKDDGMWHLLIGW